MLRGCQETGSHPVSTSCSGGPHDSRSIDGKDILLICGDKIKHDQTVFFASPLLPSDQIISCLYFVYRWSTRRRSPDAGVIDDRWVLPVFSRVNSRSRSIDDKAIRLICGEEIRYDKPVFFAAPLLPSDRVISCLYFVQRWSVWRRSPIGGVIDDTWMLPVFPSVNACSRSIDDKAVLLICGDKIRHDRTVFFDAPLLPSARIISCLCFVWVLPVFSRVNSRSRSIDDKAIRLICGEEISRSIDGKDILLICGDKIKHDQTVFFASPLLPSDQIISCLYFVYRWSTRRRSPDAGVIDDRWVLPVFSRVNSRSRSIDDKAIRLICGEEIRYDKTVFFAAPLLPSDRVISCLYFVQRWSVWRRSPIGGVIDDTWMLPVFPSVNACSRSIDDKAVLLICGDKIRHDRTVFFDAPLLPSARIISCLCFVWVLPVFSRVNSRSRSIDDKAIRLICGEEISRSIDDKDILLICGDKIKHDQTVFFASPLLPSDQIISCLYFVYRWSTRRRSPDAGVIDDRWVLPVFSRVNSRSRSIDDKAIRLICGEEIRYDKTVFFAAPLLPSDRVISCLYFPQRWSVWRRSPIGGVIDDRWVLPVFSRVNSRSRSIDDKAIRLICGEEIRYDQTVFFAAPLLPSDRIISCLYFVQRWSIWRRSPNAGVIDDTWVLPVFSSVNACSRSFDDKAVL
ncbi:hypothetical protein V5799_028820 [Amblyomma americanum]|uniref:Uncharacterized protein n=1 Tax=Amblyomma americanum TaxID=6943 RepID=A0AAQ4DBT3_AMBAM